MTDWQTDPPQIGVPLEIETTAGTTVTGEASFIASHIIAGKRRNQYMLRGGGRAIFEVERWRRVEA